jgi:23S rRNA (guanine2445-N2)-methyltransferase / 23S rRNA (guanine2069-N7)-methyltransferase
MSSELQFFASCPKGLELLLADELRHLGVSKASEKLAGVQFFATLQVAYRACLWSRLANRILLKLTDFPAETPEQLYAGTQMIAWDQHLDTDSTLSVNFVTNQSEMTHTLFGAQKVKDAIVDQLRDQFGVRPNVAKSQADVVINVYVYKNVATVSIDLSGESLHKRGYRLAGGAAPLKENLAAAILLRSKWPQISKLGGALVDPMCGSGTLLIEAAMMAADVAPGLLREYFGLFGWKQHQPSVWQALIEEANAQRDLGLKTLPQIVGYDQDPEAIKIAFDNIDRAGLRGKIHVEKRPLENLTLNATIKTGLIVTNPPYGERLGEGDALQFLYTALGDKFKSVFEGWQGAVFTGNPELGKQMGIRAKKYYALFNGVIPCQLLLFDIASEKFIDRTVASQNSKRIEAAQEVVPVVLSESVQMFVNRLRKNIKNNLRWANREQISCLRIYDKDLPEYAFSIDLYGEYVQVKEYQAPKIIDKDKTIQRQQEVLAVLPGVLNVPSKHIFYQRYRRLPSLGQVDVPINISDFQVIQERDLHFLINLMRPEFSSGFELEQRGVRDYILKQASGCHFLSLFDYAGVMSVCAAKGGATSTKTFVESDREVSWVSENFALNKLESHSNSIVNANLDHWLAREKSKYTMIYADISQFEETEELLYELLKLLAPHGYLIVASYHKINTLNSELIAECQLEDLSTQLAAVDFTRQSKLKRIYKLS